VAEHDRGAAAAPARHGPRAADAPDAHVARGDAPGAFDRDTALNPITVEPGPDRAGSGVSFAAQLAPDWCINGRPHGGYMAAILLRALTHALDEPDRAPRSLTIHYARPPSHGPVRIYTATQRMGGSLSTLSARMEQGGELVALALCAFSLARASLEVAELPMPDVAGADPARRSDEQVSARIERGHAPAFMRKLVLQPRGGATPFAGSDQPLESCAWLGLAEAARPLDAVALALFSDAHFPTPFARLTQPAGAPTIDLTVHFRAADALRRHADTDDLCLTRFRSRVIHEGFFEEDGVIWGADGTVLAQSRQLALLLAREPG
jgi:acyl-CoA thioesterase